MFWVIGSNAEVSEAAFGGSGKARRRGLAAGAAALASCMKLRLASPQFSRALRAKPVPELLGAPKSAGGAGGGGAGGAAGAAVVVFAGAGGASALKVLALVLVCTGMNAARVMVATPVGS